MAASALIEAAELAASIVEAVKNAKELGEDVYDLVTSAYNGLTKIFEPAKPPHYVPRVAYLYSRSLNYVEPLRFGKCMMRLVNVNYSLYYEREFARSLVSSITQDHSDQFFHNEIFKPDAVAIIVSREPFVSLLTSLSKSLSLTRHPTHDELQTHRVMYFTAVEALMMKLNDPTNVYDKEKYEFTFKLMVVE